MAEQPTELRLLESFRKKDKYGALLYPGDVCVWSSKRGGVICVYLGTAPGGKTGRYGLFYTPDGKKSIAYSSVVVAYDIINKRRFSHDIAKKLIRMYYG